MSTQNAGKYRIVSSVVKFTYTSSIMNNQGIRIGAFLPTFLN